MNIESIVFLCSGVAAVVAGGALLAYRQRVADWIQKNGEPRYGNLLPSYYGKSKPGVLIFPGVGAMMVGAWLIASALTT